MGYINVEETVNTLATESERLAEARCFIFRDGKDSLARLYADADLTDMQANPLIADENGAFNGCFALAGAYRLVVKTPSGALINSFENVEIDSSDLTTVAAIEAMHLDIQAERIAIEAARASAEDAESGAVSAQTQAELSAMAAGSPLFTGTAAGLAATVNGEVFLVTTTHGIEIYENISGTESFLGWLGETLYANASDLLASTDAGFVVGTVIRTREENFAYVVANASVSDQNVTTAGGVKLYVVAGNDGGMNIKAFGAIGDGVADDLSAIQGMFAGGAISAILTEGVYNLNGGTLVLPASTQISLAGGMFTNGTIVCDNTVFTGIAGLTETITLQGTVANETGVFFDWFTCEKGDEADYSTFINLANSNYGAIPTISPKNRLIFEMLNQQRHRISFGGGIYPFDAELSVDREFYIVGVSREKTLIWCPNSAFLHFSSGGATYPYIKNITIESDGPVLLTDAHTVNAIHGLVLENGSFCSYSDHCFHNDITVSGGTSCPIYGSRILNCAVFAGEAKGCFAYWHSQSNVFDNVVDYHLFFNRQETRHKSTMKAIFYNTNVMHYINSNVSYSGMDYVFYGDRPVALFIFRASNNVFEVGGNSYQAIVKTDALSSNIILDTRANFYVGDPKENGYHYILNTGNDRIFSCDSPTPLFSGRIRNYGDQYLRSVGPMIDANGTKYRLGYHEPRSVESDGISVPNLVAHVANADLAEMIGMGALYASDAANISYIEVRPSARMANSRKLGGGFGTTAARPTFNLLTGFEYFDTTLGYPIWYNGLNWVDHAGTAV